MGGGHYGGQHRAPPVRRSPCSTEGMEPQFPWVQGPPHPKHPALGVRHPPHHDPRGPGGSPQPPSPSPAFLWADQVGQAAAGGGDLQHQGAGGGRGALGHLLHRQVQRQGLPQRHAGPGGERPISGKDMTRLCVPVAPSPPPSPSPTCFVPPAEGFCPGPGRRDTGGPHGPGDHRGGPERQPAALPPGRLHGARGGGRRARWDPAATRGGGGTRAGPRASTHRGCSGGRRDLRDDGGGHRCR